MAWIFSLSAECGSEEISAIKFAQHFMGQILILSMVAHAYVVQILFKISKTIGGVAFIPIILVKWE